MKILYIGETSTHNQYVKGNVPSHWLYGAVEMEKDGHEVIWAQETHELYNDLKCIMSSKPDIIFIPNLNFHNHLLLLLLSSLKIIHIPIYAYLHHEPGTNRGLKGAFYKQLLKGLNHIFFLSDLSMKKTVDNGLADAARCSTPKWGPDKDFYNRIETSDNGWYVSTGKENRDFDTLIEVFRINGRPLHILTSTSHNGEDYTDLQDKCRDIPNIKVTLVKSSPENYAFMVRKMASAKALVCPLRKDRLNYCVGLSTIADAEGLNKPTIITQNPYHTGREDMLIQVKSVQDWIDAIDKIEKCEMNTHSDLSIKKTYENMKRIMAI